MVPEGAPGERAVPKTFERMGSMEGVTVGAQVDGEEPLDSWATAHLKTISTEGHVPPPPETCLT